MMNNIETRVQHENFWAYVASDTIVPLMERVHNMWGKHPDAKVTKIHRYLDSPSNELTVKTSLSIDKFEMDSRGLTYRLSPWSVESWGFYTQKVFKKVDEDYNFDWVYETEQEIRNRLLASDKTMNVTQIYVDDWGVDGKEPRRDSRIVLTNWNEFGVAQETTIAFQ